MFFFCFNIKWFGKPPIIISQIRNYFSIPNYIYYLVLFAGGNSQRLLYDGHFSI